MNTEVKIQKAAEHAEILAQRIRDESRAIWAKFDRARGNRTSLSDLDQRVPPLR